MNCVKRSGIYNRIWLPVALVLTVLLGIISIDGLSVQALALEQQARCGIEAHTHGDDCYKNDIFVCDVPVHTHTENCYLVLLKDNDINALLTQVEKQPDNALETVIDQSVDSALQFNQNLTSPLATEEIRSSDVAAINETIAENNIQPRVMLNENIITSYGGDNGELPQGTATSSNSSVSEINTPIDPLQIGEGSAFSVSDGQSSGLTSTFATDPLQLPQSGGISTMSLDDPVSTGTSMANYYIYLDNGWRTVGSLQFTTGRSGTRYYASETTNDILNLYNSSLGLSLTSSNLRLRYATSATATSWTTATSSGGTTYFGNNYSRQNNARATKYVRLVDSSNNPLAFYTVTFRYQDGSETVQYVRSGTSVTLPEGSPWLSDTTEYAGGEQVAIYSAKVFIEQVSDGRVRISYDVNFPAVSGVTVTTEPTILGSTETTLTDIIELETDARIRNVSQQNVIGKVNGNGVGLSRAIGFKGWQIEGTDTILSANATLTWAELQAYVDGGHLLKLLGVWEYRAQQTASFYIRYDSVAVDTEGNMTSQDSNLYTPELFAAFIGGDDVADLSVNDLNNRYYIADTTSDNSYGADQEIRSMYGQTSGIWLQSFPRDEDVFELLKDYADYLSVDGEPVDVNELNVNGYAIRWYVFKCQSDAWHIDGKLVRKEGYLDISKSFAGNKQAIAEVMDSFYMTASNTTGSKYYLYVNEPEYVPRDGTVLIASQTDTMTYDWSVEHVKYGEQWTVTEDPGIPTDSTMVVHSSYRVVDAYNTQSKSGDGTQVDVTGMTYATDMGEIQALRVEFTNIYHTHDSVIIKKEDATTGSPLGGAVFALLQNGEYLRFSYDAQAERYIYDPEGDITELTGNGYYELVIEGFSYDNGIVEVQELQSPEGYVPVENVLLGDLGDGTIGVLNDSDMVSYDDGLLTVRNSTDSTSVTVTKQWFCPAEEWQPVTVQLLANDLPVTVLISGVEPTVVLSEENGYTATWYGLPRYANGAEIIWSVRETKIGNEDCLSDFTFANWLVDYSYPYYTYDDMGRLVNTSFTVSNDTRRTMLRLIKTNQGGGLRLEGATFTLERLVNGEVDPAFVIRTMTTGADGTLTFDNLKYGDYRLTEIQPPVGYFPLDEPAYLTIHADGTVTVQGHPFVYAGTTAFSIQVLNQPEKPLPLTGGKGTGGYTAWGILLIMAALGLALPKFRRKGADSRSG